MEHRLAFTARAMRELQEKLSGYLEGKAASGQVDECFWGEVS
jgi:acyl transferase domain-containing protein